MTSRLPDQIIISADRPMGRNLSHNKVVFGTGHDGELVNAEVSLRHQVLRSMPVTN